MSLLRYPAAFVDWTGTKLKKMDRRARKSMAIHRALNHNMTQPGYTYLENKESEN